MKYHLRQDIDYVIGIDEAGRGPLAGPVSIGIVAIPFLLYKDVTEEFSVIHGAKDSKQMSADKRNKVFTIMKQYSSDESVQFTKSFVHANTIDTIGISRAIKRAIRRGLKRMGVDPDRAFVYLDGSLSAPIEYKQATIIGGDDKVPIISMASIVAKVTRDAYMYRAHCQYPEYGFDQHKGYGTKLHRKKIKRHGLSKIHRRTYCKNCSM